MSPINQGHLYVLYTVLYATYKSEALQNCFLQSEMFHVPYITQKCKEMSSK